MVSVRPKSTELVRDGRTLGAAEAVDRGLAHRVLPTVSIAH